MSAAIFFLQLPPPKAFGELRSTAADPDKFLFVCSQRHRDAAKIYPVTSVAGGSSFFVSDDEVTSLDSVTAGSATAVASPGGALFSFGTAGSPLLAFALSNRASDDPGSFKIRTNCVAGDKSNPSNCARKTLSGGKSARASSSEVETAARSMKPSFSIAFLNSVTKVLNAFATGATSFFPVTTAVWPVSFPSPAGNPESAMARFRKLFFTT